MLADNAWFRILRAIVNVLLEVTVFWWWRLYNYLRRNSPRDIYTRTLFNAHSYEEWEAAAFQLDEVLGNDLWRQNATSKHYDYRLLYSRLQAIITHRESEDILSLLSLLRSGLVRNLGNITAFRLYDRAYAGTKLLIEDYITQVTLAVDAIAAHPTPSGNRSGLTSQYKLDFLHDTRQAFGRTALVLQGGAVFGVCHLGVVKALGLRGLLPRIIVGTGAGALVAALVGVCLEEELLEFLEEGIVGGGGSGYDQGENRQDEGKMTGNWVSTKMRRLYSDISAGYFLDVATLEKCVVENVGDVTFEEAYSRTRKVLNISVPNDYASGIPSLFNYLTTPNVLIRSAALASNALTSMTPPPPILSKGLSGEFETWSTAEQDIPNLSSTKPHDSHSTPLTRVAELFNVNHYIVSQARPYLAPFLQTRSSLSATTLRHASSRRRGVLLPLLRVFGLEVQHRLRQMDTFGLIPRGIKRFLVDDIIPSAHVTLVPELAWRDIWKLTGRPSKARMQEWILRGERSVWPAITALRVRCRVENEIDTAYQIVRRRKPMDALSLVDPGSPARLRGAGEKRKRIKVERTLRY